MALTPFHEIRLDDDIALGAQGGPEFLTVVVETSSGQEYRNITRPYPLHSWDLGYRPMDQARYEKLKAFFVARFGQTYGFRFKDHGDFNAVNLPLKAIIGQPTKAQLVRPYLSGVTLTREIKKPVEATVNIKHDGVIQAATINYTTGVVTLPGTFPSNITNISQANPCQVTYNSGTFTNGDLVWITGVEGMSQVNENIYVVSSAGASPLTLQGINSTTYNTYTGGGYMMKYNSATAGMIWSGQFDVPVRFVVDKFNATLEAFDGNIRAAYSIGSLPIKEIYV